MGGGQVDGGRVSGDQVVNGSAADSGAGGALPPGWVIRDLTADVVAAGYGSLREQCAKFGIPLATGKRWLDGKLVRGGTAGRVFGSPGVLVVEVSDFERMARPLADHRRGELVVPAPGAAVAAGAGLSSKSGGEDAGAVDCGNLKPLVDVLGRIRVVRQTALNWIQQGKVEGRSIVVGGRTMWMVNEHELAWKAIEKDQKRADQWMEMIVVNGYGPEELRSFPDHVFELFDRVREVCRLAGKPCPDYPRRVSPVDAAGKTSTDDPLGGLVGLVQVYDGPDLGLGSEANEDSEE